MMVAGRWLQKQSVVLATLGLLGCGQTKSTGAFAEPPAAGGDGGDGAGGSPPVPEGCEEAGGFVGDPSWSGTLTVDSDAIYCSQFPSAKSLREELDSKARLTIFPGSYRLPSEGGEFAFKLPLCVAEAGRVFVSDVGSMVHTANESSDSLVHRYRFAQPLIGAKASIVSDLSVHSDPAALVAVTLSGVDLLPPGDPVSFIQQRCDETSVCDERSLNFRPCASPNYSEYAYRAEFSTGWVEFYVQRGPGLGATARSVLVRAIGSLSETRFEQADFFKLVLRDLSAPQFAVLFDRSVSGVRGIEVQDFSVAPPEVGTAPPRVYLIDANLERITELSDSTFDFRVVRSAD